MHDLRLSRGRADVAVTSDRGSDRLRIYRIDRDRRGGPLTDITDPTVPLLLAAIPWPVVPE